MAYVSDITSSANYLDVRNIIARVEELREDAERDDSDNEELATLESLLDDLKDNGCDEQWNGDWYPVMLIRDSYFEGAMDELIADCYDLAALNLPSFVTLTVDYKALQMDYSSVEYDGVTYWYR